MGRGRWLEGVAVGGLNDEFGLGIDRAEDEVSELLLLLGQTLVLKQLVGRIP